MKYSISAGTVQLILSFLEQKGIDRHSFLQALHLNEEMLQNADSRVTTERLQALWSHAIKHTQNELLPLELGTYINPYSLGVLSYLLMNCATLRLALEKLCLYQDVACAGIKAYVDLHDDRCEMRLEIHDEDIKEPSYAVNSEMSVYLKIIEALIGERLPVQKAQFIYNAPKNTAPYKKIFGTDTLVFNAAHCSMWFPSDYLNKVIPHANAALFPLFEKHLDDYLAKVQQSDTMSYKVREEISRLLKGEEPKLIMVARSLGIGERSIQLKLSEEGTSFRELLDEVRKALAIAHFRENKISTTDISFLLGFSEPSVFSRTFKKWTGQSPNAYRKTLV